jgi:hypothetical protein
VRRITYRDFETSSLDLVLVSTYETRKNQNIGAKRKTLYIDTEDETIQILLSVLPFSGQNTQGKIVENLGFKQNLQLSVNAVRSLLLLTLALLTTIKTLIMV